MNEIINTFLLAEEKYMPEMHLKHPGFTYSACGPFTTNKERIKKVKETWNPSYNYQTESHKVCFQHDISYEHLKDLNRIAAADELFKKI